MRLRPISSYCKTDAFFRTLKMADMSDNIYSNEEISTSDWMEQLLTAGSSVVWNDNKHTDLSSPHDGGSTHNESCSIFIKQ